MATNFREWWEMNVDVKEHKDAYFRTIKILPGTCRSTPEDFSPIYWDNPYYVRYESYENDSRYRFLSYVSLNYAATDWFNLLGRFLWILIPQEESTG